jgi:hypothetical protein
MPLSCLPKGQKMKNVPFAYSKDSGMSEKDFNEAIQGLIEKGMVQEVMVAGKIQYQLTSFGQAIGLHLESDASTQN